MADYWCDNCNDTTVVKLAGNGYRACVTCNQPCSYIKDLITQLRRTVTHLRDVCEQKQDMDYHIAKKAVELWEGEYVGQPQQPLWTWAVSEAKKGQETQ